MKQRIITGVIFGIVVLFLTNFSIETASAFLLIVGVLSAYEFLMIVFTKAFRVKVFIYLLIQIILAYIIILDEGRTLTDSHLLYLCLAYTGYSVMSIYLPSISFNHRQFALFHLAFYITIPFVLLYKFMLNSSMGHSEILMSILCFIWLSDSGAYFVGSKFGKNKLLERISPGKTWEGSLGAGIICIITSIILHFVFPAHSLIYWVVIAVTIWVIGTYGDLYESSIKRLYNVKDSGNLLPGHGGFLDRFDSFILVIPTILLIWNYFSLIVG